MRIAGCTWPFESVQTPSNSFYIKNIYNLNEPITGSSRYIGMTKYAKIDEEEIDHLPEFTD